MWRSDVGVGGALGFAFGLAFGQHPYHAGQAVEFLSLAGDHVGQVVNRAGQVGDAFFLN